MVKLFRPEALAGRDWWFTDPPGYTGDQSVLEEFDKEAGQKLASK
ncbi:TPA: hypothetical protein ACGO7X_001334 [Streptococcus suis]